MSRTRGIPLLPFEPPSSGVVSGGWLRLVSRRPVCGSRHRRSGPRLLNAAIGAPTRSTLRDSESGAPGEDCLSHRVVCEGELRAPKEVTLGGSRPAWRAAQGSPKDRRAWVPFSLVTFFWASVWTGHIGNRCAGTWVTLTGHSLPGEQPCLGTRGTP